MHQFLAAQGGELAVPGGAPEVEFLADALPVRRAVLLVLAENAFENILLNGKPAALGAVIRFGHQATPRREYDGKQVETGSH